MKDIEDELKKFIAEAVDNGLYKYGREASVKKSYEVTSQSLKFDLVVEVQPALGRWKSFWMKPGNQ